MLRTLTPDDVKWLNLVREGEARDRKPRPMPTPVQARLRSYGLIEMRQKRLVLTRDGINALKEAQA